MNGPAMDNDTLMRGMQQQAALAAQRGSAPATLRSDVVTQTTGEKNNANFLGRAKNFLFEKKSGETQAKPEKKPGNREYEVNKVVRREHVGREGETMRLSEESEIAQNETIRNMYKRMSEIRDEWVPTGTPPQPFPPEMDRFLTDFARITQLPVKKGEVPDPAAFDKAIDTFLRTNEGLLWAHELGKLESDTLEIVSGAQVTTKGRPPTKDRFFSPLTTIEGEGNYSGLTWRDRLTQAYHAPDRHNIHFRRVIPPGGSRGILDFNLERVNTSAIGIADEAERIRRERSFEEEEYQRRRNTNVDVDVVFGKRPGQSEPTFDCTTNLDVLQKAYVAKLTYVHGDEIEPSDQDYISARLKALAKSRVDLYDATRRPRSESYKEISMVDTEFVSGTETIASQTRREAPTKKWLKHETRTFVAGSNVREVFYARTRDIHTMVETRLLKDLERTTAASETATLTATIEANKKRLKPATAEGAEAAEGAEGEAKTAAKPKLTEAEEIQVEGLERQIKAKEREKLKITSYENAEDEIAQLDQEISVIESGYSGLITTKYTELPNAEKELIAAQEEVDKYKDMQTERKELTETKGKETAGSISRGATGASAAADESIRATLGRLKELQDADISTHLAAANARLTRATADRDRLKAICERATSNGKGTSGEVLPSNKDVLERYELATERVGQLRKLRSTVEDDFRTQQSLNPADTPVIPTSKSLGREITKLTGQKEQIGKPEERIDHKYEAYDEMGKLVKDQDGRLKRTAALDNLADPENRKYGEAVVDEAHLNCSPAYLRAMQAMFGYDILDTEHIPDFQRKSRLFTPALFTQICAAEGTIPPGTNMYSGIFRNLPTNVVNAKLINASYTILKERTLSGNLGNIEDNPADSLDPQERTHIDVIRAERYSVLPDLTPAHVAVIPRLEGKYYHYRDTYDLARMIMLLSPTPWNFADTHHIKYALKLATEIDKRRKMILKGEEGVAGRI